MAQEPATALLIVDLDKHIGNARAWRDPFGEQLPDLEIRISPDAGNLADIEYLAFMHPHLVVGYFEAHDEARLVRVHKGVFLHRCSTGGTI